MENGHFFEVKMKMQTYLDYAKKSRQEHAYQPPPGYTKPVKTNRKNSVLRWKLQRKRSDLIRLPPNRFDEFHRIGEMWLPLWHSLDDEE